MTKKNYVKGEFIFESDLLANNLSGTNTGDKNNRQLTITFDGGGFVPDVGSIAYIRVPYSGTIKGWTITSDIAGSCVLDVWKDTYANYPPLVADSIAGTEKPTLTAVAKNEDLTLTTWTTSVTAGDIIAVNIDSASTLTKIFLAIHIEATN